MKQKIKAFFIHISLSSIVFCSFLAIMFLYWYPQPYFTICEGMTVLTILAITDVILGPILTFIIYKPKKPWLKLDLSIIATVQICALIYGSSIIYSERPLFLVFTIDRFEIISASDVDINEITTKAILDTPTPYIVFAQAPKDRGQRSYILDSAIKGKDLERFPKYYKPFKPYLSEVFNKSISIKLLTEKHPDNKKLKAFLSDINKGNLKYKFLPVRSKQKDMTVIISEHGDIIDFLDISPWI